MDNPQPPARMEKGIRFGCGFSFGVLVVGIALLRGITSPNLPLWYYLGTAGGALVMAMLAMRFGDTFYEKFVEFMKWLG